MRYYDIAVEPCDVNPGFAARLGFERVFVSNGKRLFSGSDTSRLSNAVQRGAAAVSVTDFSLDRKLMARIKDSDSVLCISFVQVFAERGLARARLLRRASILLKYARSRRIDVSFASLADSRMLMCSRMQLMALAKSIGASEEFARDSIGRVNKKVGEALDEA